MVRNSVDLCAFCGEAPCSCNGPSKKRVPEKREKLPDSDKTDIPDIPGTELQQPRKKLFAEAMKAKAAQAPPPPPPQPVRTHVHRAVNLEAAMFESAIRALGPLLAPEEQQKYRAILTSEPTLEEQRVVWKARRNGLFGGYPENTGQDQ